MSKNLPVPEESRPDEPQSGPWQVEQTVLREVSVAGSLTIGDVTQTTHVHLPPPPKTEPKHFTVPYLRNEFFTGRNAILTQIHNTLGQTGTAALSQAQAIHGLGGVGKTQTAVEYAHRYFQQPSGYDWVLWVNASSLTLSGSFGAIATDLALPNHQENKLDENIAAVKRWLSTNERWLLIFDNVDDPDTVQPFLPNAPNGRILITSRLPRLERLGVGRAIALDILAPEDAHTFLLRRTQCDSIDAAEQQALETLAQELGYLPLALEQAAAYIQTKGVSFAAYWRVYQQRRLQVLEKEQPQVGNYPASVATTWGINFEAVQASSPAAADVLRLSAFLAPDNIPYEILSLGKDHLGKTLATALAEVAEDELVIPELLAELTRYSLMRLETEDRYSIHRLVQEVLRDRLTPEQRQQWLDRAVNALNATFPSPEFGHWRWCARLVEQVQACTMLSATETLEFALLLSRAGYYLKEKGCYGEAELLHQQSLKVYQSQLGSDHPFIATSLNNLAGLYQAQGRYGEAESLYKQALAIWRSHLGTHHPDTASSLNNLATLYRSQGRYGEAEPLYKQVLEITRFQLGSNHPHTATSLNNLAGLYDSQGRYGEAEPLYQRALEIRRSQLGASHPHTAHSLNNLAELYRAQGRYGEAEPLLQQALEIMRSQLGSDHPYTATSLNNLAGLYKAQGRYGEASPLLQQALEITRSQLGNHHPDTASSLNNLAGLYRAQGHYGEAEPLYQKALEIMRSQLGSDHPYTATSLNNLAELYRAQGRYGEAEPFYQQALAIRQSQLGSQHPHTANSLNNLAGLYRVQGFYGEAEPLYQKALEIIRLQLGDTHPDTATSLNNLAELYCAQGCYGKAEPLYLEALSILFNQLGENHPNTQTGWENFAHFVQQVISAGRTVDLSDHPLTQDVLAQLQQE